jgi:ribosomal protein S18 acetylase RimI-like enzyme
MEIREIRQDEIESLVLDCWLPFAKEMAALDEYNALAEDVRDDALTHRQEQFENEDVVIYVAVENDHFVGYVSAERNETPPVFQRGMEVNIGELYVKQSYRGQGIASALMEHAEQWAAECGAEHVTLSVNGANELAQALYDDRGYDVRRYKMDKNID